MLKTVINYLKKSFQLGVKIVRIHKDAILPEYCTKGSAGFDIFASEDIEIPKKKIVLINTGLAIVNNNKNYFIQIAPRSSLGSQGITIVNSPGIVDPDFDFEIKVCLYNTTNSNFVIEKGQAYAQGIFIPFIRPGGIKINPKKRTGGFGSTNVCYKNRYPKLDNNGNPIKIYVPKGGQ